MNALRLTSPRDAIETAIALNGPRRVLLAALRALLRPPTRPPDIGELPDYLRQDVGLSPRPLVLPSQRHLF